MLLKSSTMVRILLAIVAVSLMLGAIETAYQRNLASKLPELEQQAQFGDSFGGLNTLFSGCAFIGIIVTLVLQLEELKLQRTSLRLQEESVIRQTNISIAAAYITTRTVGFGDDRLLDDCVRLLENHLRSVVVQKEEAGDGI